jgi:hypothetical protein
MEVDMSLQRNAPLAAILGGLLWIAFHLYYIFSGIVGASILLIALGAFLMALSVFSLLGSPVLETPGKLARVSCLLAWHWCFLALLLPG